MNFPLILVAITALTGIYWLIDSLLFARKREGEEPLMVEYARSFFPVLFIVLVLRSFLFEPFRIPSGSMIPTLLVGDFILVSKFSYGVRLPVVHTKILDTGKPENGDVAVFRFPDNPKVDYIKRVVGIPGDKITLRGKKLLLNGEPVDYSANEPYVMPGTDDITVGATVLSESLGEVAHEILVFNRGRGMPGPHRTNLGIADDDIVFDDTGSIIEYSVTVPEGTYFMLGDNRDNSNDSRFWGFVPEANLVGKAKYIWMHWNKGILWSRLGDRIQ